MKKYISILSLVCVVMLLLTSCGQIKTKNPSRPSDMAIAETSQSDLYNTTSFDLIASNDKCELYFNKLTTDIKVKVKSTGYEWSTISNYEGAAFAGQIFEFDYTTLAGNMKTMSSDVDCISKGQFTYKIEKNGIKIHYSIGDVAYEFLCPGAMDPDRFEHYLSLMTPEEKASMELYYFKFDFNDPGVQIRTDTEKAMFKKMYPLALKKPWIYPTQGFSDSQKREINAIFKRIGYTTEDLANDNKGVNTKVQEPEEFNINIHYTLEGDELSVRIPEKEIYHSQKFMIERIRILKNFGSTVKKEDGYYLLPDGSGSIMNFYNGKDALRLDPLYIPIYGVDKSLYYEEKTAYNNQAIFPVYGVNINNKNGMFAIIEAGETFAGVEAHPGSVGDESTTPSAPSIWPEFRINEKVRLKSLTTDKNSKEMYNLYQFQRYLGDIKIKFKFLTGEKSTYSGMAEYYSDYLFKGRELSGLKPYTTTIEMPCVIDTKANFLGVPYKSKATLTTFDDVKRIATELKNAGLSSINLKLSGWFGGGYRHGFTTNIAVESRAGGKAKFIDLINDMKTAGINLYPDADVQYVYSNALLFEKPNKSLVASYLNKKQGIYTGYNPVSFNFDVTSPRYILTPKAVSKNINGVASAYSKFGIKNVSLRYIGEDILANYREKDFTERQEVLNLLVKDISDLKAKGFKIMGSTGDAPFLKYLDVINNLPVDSANYDKTDYSVPFTAMVLSGYADYTYKPINLSNNEPVDLLKLIESGAGANFVLTGQKYTKLNTSEFNYLYSTNYGEIKDDVLKLFKKLQDAQKDTYGVRIINHQKLADDVYITKFENGSYAVVNYSKQDYDYAGRAVKSRDFITGKVNGGVGVGN